MLIVPLLSLFFHSSVLEPSLDLLVREAQFFSQSLPLVGRKVLLCLVPLLKIVNLLCGKSRACLLTSLEIVTVVQI